MDSKESDHPFYGQFELPQRTSSQKKALKYFTKEIERYADITSAPGKKADFTPTISPTPLSLDTVEELLPYRDQFLAAGLAVTSTDQRTPKGKEKEVTSSCIHQSEHVQRTPDYAQFDGRPADQSSSSSSSPSSGETMIQFDDLDPALIEELPEPKRKSKKQTTLSRWLHGKSQPIVGGKPGIFMGPDSTKNAERPPKPSFSIRPASPSGPQLPQRSKKEDQTVRGGTGQYPPVPVHVQRPTRRRDSVRAGKLPELPEDIQWRTQPGQPDRSPPSVPPKNAVVLEKPAIDHRSHKPVGIRRAGSSIATTAPPRSKSHSHVRNRHAPLEKPASTSRLSGPFQQPTDMLRLNAGHPGHHGPTADKTLRSRKARVGEKGRASTLPAVVEQLSEQPTDALMLNAGHPGQHGTAPDQAPASSGKAQRGKENSMSRTPPAMVKHTDHSTPELPMTWKYAVGTPSSFEEALDDVVRKLDSMELKSPLAEGTNGEKERGFPRETTYIEETKAQSRDPIPKQDSLPDQIQSHLRKTPAKPKASASPEDRLKRAVATRRKAAAYKPKPTTSSPQPQPHDQAEKPTSKAEHVPTDKSKPVAPPGKPRERPHRKKPATKPPPSSPTVKDKTVDHQDRDIDDRDVLRGLKLAVSAACDENYDFWIRQKTGLRLRRFLADLKTFEELQPEDAGTKVVGEADEKGVPGTGRDGADEEEAGLGDDEADPDDQRAKRRRAEKGRVEQDREFQRKRRQVNRE